MPTVKLAMNLHRSFPIEGEKVKKRHVMHKAGEIIDVTDAELEQFPFLGEELSEAELSAATEPGAEAEPLNVIGVPREPLELPRPLKPAKAKPSPRKG